MSEDDDPSRLVVCEENGRPTFRIGAWVCSACFINNSTQAYGDNGQYLAIHRQALVKFENGWTLSIAWSPMTYSDNYHWPIAGTGVMDDHIGYWFMGYRVNETFVEEPRNVEIAVLMPERYWETAEIITGPDGSEVGRVQRFILDNEPLRNIPVTAIPDLCMGLDRIGTDDLDAARALVKPLLADDE